MADVWVRLPLGALFELPPCCSGSLPSWYGGSVGSIPTGGFGLNVRDTPVWSSGFNSPSCHGGNAGSSPVMGAECWCRHGALIGYRYQAQTLMFVGSSPTRATARRMALGGRAACKPAAHARQVQFLPDALVRQRGPFVQRLRTPGSQPENRGSIPRRVIHQGSGIRRQESVTAAPGSC